MLTLLVAAFVLGLVFNATPGPVFAETVRQGVRGGFRPAVSVQIGSLVGDALWALVGLVGVSLLFQLESLRTPITIAGVTYLFWLASAAWRASTREIPVSTGDRIDTRQALRSGVLLSLTNPQNVAYWAAIGSALKTVGVNAPTALDSLVFFAGFVVSSTVWAFLVSALVDRAFRRVGARWARLTYRACVIAFLMLAFSMLRELWVAHHQSPARPEPRPDIGATGALVESEGLIDG
jgi:chemosensory pili system protein ChpE/L-lysine exporter family protein LysE/ArgO